MSVVQFAQADDQPKVINTNRIVAATSQTDGQGMRTTFNTRVRSPRFGVAPLNKITQFDTIFSREIHAGSIPECGNLSHLFD